MDTTDPLQRAIDLAGLSRLARECKVSHQAVRKWQRARRMPRTEWTGETSYSNTIQAATDGQVTREQLLAPWPPAPDTLPPAAGQDAELVKEG